MKKFSFLAVLSTIALSLSATTPPISFSVDIDNPQPFSFQTYVGNTPVITVSIMTNNTAYTNMEGGWTPYLNYAMNDAASSLSTNIDGSLDATTGVITYTGKTNSFPAAGTYFAEVYLQNGSTKLTCGQGTIYVNRSPSSGSYGGLNLKPRINWDIIENIGTVPWSDFATNNLQSQITANLTNQTATNLGFQAKFNAQVNTNLGFTALFNAQVNSNLAYQALFNAQINSNLGYQTFQNSQINSNLGYQTFQNAQVNSNLGYQTSNNNQINTNAGFEALFTLQRATNLGFQASLNAQVNTNLGFQALHNAQINTNAGFQTFNNNQTASNLLFQTQITANLTNQNATNAVLQAAINSVGTGTWSQALLIDGSRVANYINVANTNYMHPNIVTNGTFTGSAFNWTLTAFYYSENKVILNPSLTGSIEYTNALTVVTNGFYQLSVKTVYAGAAVTASVGGVSYSWTSVNNETHKEYFYATNSAKIIISAGTGTNSLELDDVTLKMCSTGSIFVAQDVNAGDSVRARVGVYAPNITAISNDYYPRNNPSNYVTATVTNGLYPSSNPSNYVTASITNTLASTNWVLTLNYYPSSNPSNFLTAAGEEMLWVAASNKVVYTNDARLTNSRPPDLHTQAWNTITGTPTSIAGYGITNTLGDSATRYNAMSNATETVDVFATATGIVATRTNSTYNINIPAGVKLKSMKIRTRGDYTDSGKIYLAMGTNDFNSAIPARTWIPVNNCFRESDYGNVVLTIRPYVTDPTLAVVAGLGTSAAETYQIHLVY